MNLAPLLLLALLAAEKDHETINPIYRQVRETGVAVGPSLFVRLPAPLMADGLSAKEQQAVLEKVVGDDFPLEDFVRNSPVAPIRQRLGDASPSDPKSPARKVEVVFVAYGSLDTLISREFRDRGATATKEAKAHTIKPDALAKRKISLTEEEAKHEGYAWLVFNLLDKVEVNAVSHSRWSRTADSIVAAGIIDDRFKNDKEYPNQWMPFIVNDEGKKVTGKPHPYSGAGYYIKFTKLAEPKGALFVEAQIVFTEPHDWFEGANLLRSKLHPVVTAQVRTFRRELAKRVR